MNATIRPVQNFSASLAPATPRETTNALNVDADPLLLNTGPGAGHIGVGAGVQTPAYPLDISGDINISGVYRINGVPVPAPSQTPWAADIDAAGHTLTNAPRIVGADTFGAHSVVDLGPSYVLVSMADAGSYLTVLAVENYNVAIRKRSPACALDVGGDANIDGRLRMPNLPQYPDLATAQAALGAGSGTLWRDANNAVFVS